MRLFSNPPIEELLREGVILRATNPNSLKPNLKILHISSLHVVQEILLTRASYPVHYSDDNANKDHKRENGEDNPEYRGVGRRRRTETSVFIISLQKSLFVCRQEILDGGLGGIRTGF